MRSVGRSWGQLECHEVTVYSYYLNSREQIEELFQNSEILFVKILHKNNLNK